MQNFGLLMLWLAVVKAVSVAPEEPFPYYVMEELLANTLIGNVAVDLKLSESYSPETLALLHYTISRQVDQLGRPVHLFDVDTRTSIMKTLIQIDRDVICPKMDSCVVFLDIDVAPLEYARIMRTTIDILDINDHAPRFPEETITKRLPESVPMGTLVNIPTAIDPDSSESGVKTYELVSSGSKFELRVHPGSNGTESSLAIVIKERLDRREAGFYQFRVVAYDGGRPPKMSSMMVNLEIGDARGSGVDIENATYEVFVLEDAEPGTTIAQVNAEDLDLHHSAVVSYSFSPTTEQRLGHLFDILEHSGTVLLTGTLDYESEPTYLLEVSATDRTRPSHITHATIIVRVQDENDHSPQISIHTGVSSGRVVLAEDARAGTLLANFSISDLDQGENARVTCRLDHPSSAMFEIRPLQDNLFSIVTVSDDIVASDRLLSMTISCSDHGKTSLTSSATLVVEVIDANNHRPEFSQRSYTATIEEHNNAGDFITMVMAVDQDEGQNGEVRYALHPDTLGDFNVDPESGIITTNVEFDREVTHTVDIKVLAYDLGQPVSLSSTATVLLTIVDIDDNPPTFKETKYPFGIFENKPPNSEVGFVSAIDADGPLFNEFTYELLVSDSEIPPEFSIDPISGHIYTRGVLDREVTPVYYMTVVAVSKSGHMSGTSSVTVYVADKNDNVPYISWPMSTNNTVYVSPDVFKGKPIAQVMASDIDLGNNGRLVYKISSGNEEGALVIDSRTGEISFNEDPLNRPTNDYSLLIVVRDQGDPVQMSRTQLHIVMNTTSKKSSPDGAIQVDTVSNTTIIVSLTVAALLLVFLLAVAIFLVRRHTHEKKAQSYQSKAPEEVPGGPGTEAQTMLGHGCVVNSRAPVDIQAQYHKQSLYEVPPSLHGMDKAECDNDINMCVANAHRNNAIAPTQVTPRPAVDKKPEADMCDAKGCIEDDTAHSTRSGAGHPRLGEVRVLTDSTVTCMESNNPGGQNVTAQFDNTTFIAIDSPGVYDQSNVSDI